MDASADVTVTEVMTREYVGVSESDNLIETVELLLREERDTALVQRGTDCVGVLTERDILKAVVENPQLSELTVSEAMTENVSTVDPDESVAGAVAAMTTESDGRLVVSNSTEPLGLLTERDLLAAQSYQTGESEPDATRRESLTAMESDHAETDRTETGFHEQSICEGCSSLSSDLSSFNGQLLCPECRSL